MTPQIPLAAYSGPSYFNKARFASYATQLEEVLQSQPRSVLEIGKGNGLLSFLLTGAGVRCVTADFDPALKPDLCLDIRQPLPLEDAAFDVVCAFEILEHVPFEFFGKVMKEMLRVCRTCVCLSVPDCEPLVGFDLRLPWIGPVHFQREFTRWRKPEHVFDGEHYWEIGKRGYPLSRILACIRQAGGEVVRTHRIFEMHRHRFFRVVHAARESGQRGER